MTIAAALLSHTLWSLVAAPAPASTAPATAPAAYDDGAAEADVAAILGEPNRAYLQARARLVAHPEIGARTLLAHIDAVPPPSGSERKRLFDVLAEIGGETAAARIADELRHGCAAETTETGKHNAAELWRPLLRDQGAHGRTALAALVADRALPVGVRAVLLDDLVDVTPSAGIADLLVLAGRGHAELRRQFARSLRKRLRGHDELSAQVLAAIDTELDAADASRLAALIQLRAAIEDSVDAGFLGRLAALARDAARPFTVRVAAVRALGSHRAEPAATAALHAIASASLPAKTQADEILAWLSLQALPAERAAGLVRSHRLDRSTAPRLAMLGWTHAEITGDGWLDAPLGDPWPEVRSAALARVGTPCSRRMVTRLDALVGDAKAGADADMGVQRAAIDALGRCVDDAAFAALRGMLDDAEVALELSGEAARELARHFGERGADAVAKQLAARPEQAYARRLAQALRHAASPTPRVYETLCAWTSEGGEVGAAAAASLHALYGADASCD